MSEKKHIISCLVNNHSGVLSKVSGLFARRGYNIESLVVCATNEKELSRMTIVALGDDAVLEQIIKQLEKLPDVIVVENLDCEEQVVRELLIIKLKNSQEQMSQVFEIAKVYSAKTVDLKTNSISFELTGDSSKIDAFISMLQPYGIMEFARTGVLALSRGTKCIKDNKKS